MNRGRRWREPRDREWPDEDYADQVGMRRRPERKRGGDGIARRGSLDFLRSPIARQSPFAQTAPEGIIEQLRHVAPACGTCRNWLADGLPGGRGACEHPGSGFMFPYADTPACQFYEGRR